MTIEELTFTAFLAGRERGREESAAQIERLREALIAVMPYAGGKAYHTAIAALQPKEGE